MISLLNLWGHKKKAFRTQHALVILCKNNSRHRKSFNLQTSFGVNFTTLNCQGLIGPNTLLCLVKIHSAVLISPKRPGNFSKSKHRRNQFCSALTFDLRVLENSSLRNLLNNEEKEVAFSLIQGFGNSIVRNPSMFKPSLECYFAP